MTGGYIRHRIFRYCRDWYHSYPVPDQLFL